MPSQDPARDEHCDAKTRIALGTLKGGRWPSSNILTGERSVRFHSSAAYCLAGLPCNFAALLRRELARSILSPKDSDVGSRLSRHLLHA
jgi:hypothetical protein